MTRRSPRWRAYSRIRSPELARSAPPISNVRLPVSGNRTAAASYANTSSMSFGVVAKRAQGVHEVVANVDTCERAIERRRIEQIPCDHLRRRPHARLERGRMTGQTPKRDPGGFEDRHEPSPDVARCSGHEH